MTKSGSLLVSRSLSKSENTNHLVIPSLEIELLYENEEPMANAEFLVIFSDGTEFKGKTDAGGIAKIRPPISPAEHFRLFLLEYEESINEGTPIDGTYDQLCWPNVE